MTYFSDFEPVYDDYLWDYCNREQVLHDCEDKITRYTEELVPWDLLDQFDDILDR